MLQFFKSPIGLTLTAATVILTLSPGARKATRRLAVKGTAAVLDLVDQVKDTAELVKRPLQNDGAVDYANDGNISH